jgi:electron-transferring-flavoprotein dehydrogenase
VGRQLDAAFGLPEGSHAHDWAVGMKFVVDLPEHPPSGEELAPGTVFHTFGYPEPEIFGFMYVHPGRIASLGIFVPSWFDNPVRTCFRTLQHWMLHPWIWRHLEGGTLRSWGAKTLQESGRRGEPRLAGDGWARIGEGSGSTNVLTGSGVDEAWATGTLLAEGVLELLAAGKPFTRDNLERAYVARRRASWIDKEARVAAKARDGFRRGVVSGLIGMGLAGLTGGRLHVPAKSKPPHRRLPTIEDYFKGRIPAEEIARIRAECLAKGAPLHGALMDRVGWPAIPHDGKLLVSHQDALLVGGKVQAPAGCADHVLFPHPETCAQCNQRTCVEVCSGQAIAHGPDGVPVFDREKCIHCGACLWNCASERPDGSGRTVLEFAAGAGGLHSAEN